MVDIQKVVETSFSVERAATSLSSYTKFVYLTAQEDTLQNPNPNLAEAKRIYTQLSGNKADDVIPLKPTKTTAEGVASEIKNLKIQNSNTANDFIFVCMDTAFNTVTADSLAAELNKFEAPHKVILCVSMSKTDAIGTDADDLIVKLSPYPVAVKLYSSTAEEVCVAIPAYYSKLRLDTAMSLRDYAFTEELEITAEGTQNKIYSLVDVGSDYDNLVNNTNFMSKIGKSIVNFGGNLSNGVAITAQFGAIAVENDIIYAVLKTMLGKQYLTNEGLNNIVSAISSAVTRYTYNGLLEQKGAYTGEDYSIQYGSIVATVIKKGTALPEGYYVHTLPMSTLTAEDRKDRKFTPITVIMQTQSGARVVSITGKIID